MLLATGRKSHGQSSTEVEDARTKRGGFKYIHSKRQCRNCISQGEGGHPTNRDMKKVEMFNSFFACVSSTKGLSVP